MPSTEQSPLLSVTPAHRRESALTKCKGSRPRPAIRKQYLPWTVTIPVMFCSSGETWSLKVFENHWTSPLLPLSLKENETHVVCGFKPSSFIHPGQYPRCRRPLSISVEYIHNAVTTPILGNTSTWDPQLFYVPILSYGRPSNASVTSSHARTYRTVHPGRLEHLDLWGLTVFVMPAKRRFCWHWQTVGMLRLCGTDRLSFVIIHSLVYSYKPSNSLWSVIASLSGII